MTSIPHPTSWIHFNIILPSTPRSSKSSTSLSFPHQSPLCTSLFSHTCHLLHPSRCSYFDRHNNRRVKSSPLFCSFFLLWSTYLPTTFLDTVSLCFFCSVRDQVSHHSNTRGKVILMYIVIFIGLNMDSKRGKGSGPSVADSWWCSLE